MVKLGFIHQPNEWYKSALLKGPAYFSVLPSEGTSWGDQQKGAGFDVLSQCHSVGVLGVLLLVVFFFPLLQNFPPFVLLADNNDWMLNRRHKKLSAGEEVDVYSLLTRGFLCRAEIPPDLGLGKPGLGAVFSLSLSKQISWLVIKWEHPFLSQMMPLLGLCCIIGVASWLLACPWQDCLPERGAARMLCHSHSRGGR